MCLLAPATLIDKRIQWFSVNELSAKAIFTNHDISISAILYFNVLGQLVNFISNDRTSLPDLNQYPFSTPASLYANFNGVNVMTYGEAIWDYPDGQFVYGKFNLQEIEYNVSSLR
jgi:hypothetical protein